MPSLGIALHPEGCTGHSTKLAPGVTSASGAMPTDVTFRRLEIGVQAIQLSPYHTGPADASVPAPGPDRRFAGMRLSRSPHGSGLAIGPRNLPSSSSRLRRGYDKAPRGAIPVIVQEAFPTGLDEAIVGVPTGWLAMRQVGDERAALLQAGQHTGHAFGAFRLSVVGLDDILFAHAFGWGWRGRRD